MLYEAIDKDKNSILLVEKVDGDVVAFVSAAHGLDRIFKKLLLKPFQLIYSLKSCLFSFSKMHKILEIILINKRDNGLSGLPKQELLSIVVSPSYQGKNYAENLFKDLCYHFKVAGVKNIKIVVGSNLLRAHSFYRKMGSIPVREIQVHKGVESLVYVKNLN